MKVLISGTMSGFGQALAQAFREAGWEVVGLNRNHKDNSIVEFPFFDLATPQTVSRVISEVVNDHPDISSVILNAGILGPVAPTREVRFDNLQEVFNVNFFSNKEIIDAMLEKSGATTFAQVSSGAARTIYEQWAPYGLTKALMLRLFDYYRVEEKEKRFLSFNPGPMPTAMNANIRALGSDISPWAPKFHDDSNLNDPVVMARRLVEIVLREDSVNEEALIDLRSA